MVDLANTVWRDFTTAGIPASGANNPKKSKIREWGTYIESLTQAAGYGNMVWFATKSALDGDLAHDAGTPAIVYADTTSANNGIYLKTGASGAGSWGQIITYLPGYQFVTATDAGAGTANAIVATSSPRVAYTDGVQLIRLNIFETNTSSGVTVAFDGGPALAIKTASNNNPAAGGLAAGMTILGVVDQSASVFRMLSDQTGAAVQAASEAALASIQEKYLGEFVNDASATSAAGGSPVEGALYWNSSSNIFKVYTSSAWAPAFNTNNWTVDSFAGDGAETDFTLNAEPGTKANAFVFVDGYPQALSTYGVSGTTLTFSEAPAGDGVTNNIEVRFGSSTEVSVGTPTDGTVTVAKLNSGVYASQGEAEAGTENTKLMTALRVAQAIDAQSPVDEALVYSLLPVGSVVQRSSNFQTGYFSTTTVLPFDDTVPQSTEGTEYLTAAITPKSATNRLRVRAVINGTPAGAGALTLAAALFKDAETSARAYGSVYLGAGVPGRFPLEYEFIPGSTSALTMRVRIGPGSAGTMYINGTASGRIGGGVQNMSLVIEEIKE